MGFRIFLLIIATVACSPSDLAQVDERPDPHSNPRKMGIEGAIDYQSLVDRPSFEADVPWTDSYWPLGNVGMARRWLDAEAESNPHGLPVPIDGRHGLPDVPLFMEQYFEAIESGDEERIVKLSPGERYDMLRHWRVIDKLERSHTMMQIKNHVKKLFDALPKAKTDADIKQNAQRLFRQWTVNPKDIPEDQRKHFVPHETMVKFKKNMFLVWEAWKSWFYYASSDEYSYPGIKGGKPWGWMGHCHGWSAASTVEAEPKHAVMALVGDQRILFTEGDLRGLHTKAWATFSPYNSINHPNQEWFVGTRCDLKPENIPADQKTGRILGGAFCSLTELKEAKDDAGPCDTQKPEQARWFSDMKVYGKRFNGKTIAVASFIQYEKPTQSGDRYRADPMAKRKFMLPRKVVTMLDGSKKAEFLDFHNMDDYGKVTKSFDTIGMFFNSRDELHRFFDKPKYDGDMYYMNFAGCRDVNPVAFHTALSHYLNNDDKRRRIVIDRTPSGQVWNQGVYKYDSRIGSLIDVYGDGFRDPLSKQRAPGTRYLAEVRTRFHFQYEPPVASIRYTTSGGADVDEKWVRSKVAHYTLEFDRNRNLIGGEWGTIHDRNRAVTQSEMERPDFMYAHNPNGLKPGRHKLVPEFDVLFLRALQKCALDTSGLKATRVNGTRVTYQECRMPKSGG